MALLGERLVVTVPRCANYAADSPETVVVSVPPQLVRSRVAPRAHLCELVLLPTRGAAAMLAPGLSTERHVQLGAAAQAAEAATAGVSRRRAERRAERLAFGRRGL